MIVRVFQLMLLILLVAGAAATAAAKNGDGIPPGTVETGIASAWPPQDVDPDYFRGNGFYLSIPKVAIVWLLFLSWVRTADWINADLQKNRLRYLIWNPIVVGSFALAFLLTWVLPWFALGLCLMLMAYIAPVLVYVFAYRNPKLADHEKVLTSDHLRFWFAQKIKIIGIKIEAEKRDAVDKGLPLQLIAKGGETDQHDQANLLSARQLPGMIAARKLLNDAVQYRADAILLDMGESVAVRYFIDGVWHNHESQSREVAGQIVQVLRHVAAIGAEAAGTKLIGQFGINVGEIRSREIDCELTVQVQGETERVLVKFSMVDEFTEKTIADLGVRAKTVEKLLEMIGQEKGLILFSALPGSGVTTTMNAVLGQADRLLRDFVSIEDAAKPEPVIQGVDVKKYNRSAEQTPVSILPSVSRTGPDVIVCRDMNDGKSATMLCELAQEHLVLATVQSKDAAEALLRVLVMKVPPAKLAAALIGVLHQQLPRTLCDTCRTAYEPTPEFLKKLGIPAGKIEKFYQTPGETVSPCNDCKGIGYRGRTGIFELLEVNDAIRKILTTNPQVDAIRKAAREAKMSSIREQGVLLVARGVTSVEEVQRILKS
ncbi:MAG: ATPase, T2SS/T4P/T4SS family [Pirellulales bacterium]